MAFNPYGQGPQYLRALELAVLDEKTLGRALITYSAGLMIPGVYLLLAPFYTAVAVAGLAVACGYLAAGIGMIHQRPWARPLVIAAASAHVTVALSLLSLILTAR